MARRVLIRSRDAGTVVARMEEVLRSQYKEIYKAHREQLEETAQDIEDDARYLVPEDTGVLADSINVYVTNSTRYPGIIASASARGRYKPGMGGYTGYDYAMVQEIGEEYSHEKPEASAHYLGGPFVLNVARLYKELTGKQLSISKDMAHAYFYVKDKL